MADNSSIPDTCITAHSLTYHPIYRISQIYQLIVLGLSVIPLVYFIFWKVLKSSFHGNLKIVLDVFLMLLVYKDSDQVEGSISFVFIPVSAAPKMYLFFVMMLILNFLNFILIFLLIQKNGTLMKSNSTLTARYQLEEVYLSTKFAISVVFVHVVFYGIYEEH
ncbi:hypothetical protein GCK72_009835 [Caenorhabditis remanei]|uniref:Uncharacterized protein n=1 Tax=Caenorhabditis remanei TaxID=31234 RepID=A0A6A5H3L8_CAERE|nr:hypothetical protein GCK72_009835 [Caenorhabditis remanei]KAF1761579.1 hypothetical protein GCK72_009835 [Caenorhabditis remanei]